MSFAAWTRSTRAARRSVTGALVTVGCVAALASCTPKPDVADDAAENFLGQLSSWVAAPEENANPGEGTDRPEEAITSLDATRSGMQAEGLDAELLTVQSQDSTATADYRLTWHLPADRELSYTSRMTLTKNGADWVVRWVPTVLHPELGARQHMELRSVPPVSATVVGSDGAVLLERGVRWRVLLNPSETPNMMGSLRRVAAELDTMRASNPDIPAFDPVVAAREAAEVSGEYSIITLNETDGPVLRDALAGVPGVRFNEEAALVRPDPAFAPDIMSRVAKLVEGDLEGENGWKVITATPEGNEVRTVGGADPTPAPSVHVSLSRTVQDAAQAAVDTRADAKTMMVVMRPSTGEVLAVAQTKKADEDGNVALMGQYPPGSTFKILTAFAGIERQGLNAGSTVGCPGTQNIGGRIVTNYNSFSLGSTSLLNAFAKSCNTTFADISTQLAPGQLKDTAAQFGLGLDFKIDGLDTFTGSVPEGEVMLDRTEAGYGQGLDLASPFGMALVSSTVAHGSRPTPFLIAGEGHKTAVTASEEEKASQERLDPAQLDELRAMMRAVVTSGSGAGAAGAGEVFAKTGEAEINAGSHSWFTGYRGDLAFATLIVLGGGSEHAVAVTNTFFRNLDEANMPH